LYVHTEYLQLHGLCVNIPGMKNPILKVISPSQSAHAAALALGVNRETFRRWYRNGAPLECALYVEQVTNGVVTAEDVVAYCRWLAAQEAESVA
jgi:hypothetical protein